MMMMEMMMWMMWMRSGSELQGLKAMHVVTTDDDEEKKDFYISTFSHSLADLALTGSSELASQSVWEKFQFGVSRSTLLYSFIIP